MKKLKFILLIIIVIITIVFILYRYEYYYPNLWVKDFETVQDDYNKIVEILYDYYEKEKIEGEINVIIDNSEYEIRYEDILIELSDEEKQSLKRVCENSYEGYYGLIRISKNDVIFNIDEANSYGIMYTKNFDKSKEKIEEKHDDFKFKRINSKWYEIGHFRRQSGSLYINDLLNIRKSKEANNASCKKIRNKKVKNINYTCRILI